MRAASQRSQSSTLVNSAPPSGTDRHLLGRVDQAATSARSPATPRTPGCARATRSRRAHPSGCGCRSARRRSGASRTRSTSTWPCTAHMSRSSSSADPRLVVVRHARRLAPARRAITWRERVGHRPPAVEHALGRVVAGVDALAGHAVVLGRVPRHQRLPHVVVGEVAVLVVRRVEVGEVARRRASRATSSASPRTAAPAPGEQLRHPQRERLRTSAAPTASRRPSARRWWSRPGRRPRSGW